ncbi:MAG TPA: hypothetical protein VK920_08240 [Solirubrobacterales bacterium]|nr:hypothetical protein [Solirubrobacterales bacterium]
MLAPATPLLAAAALAGCGPFGDDGDGSEALSEEDLAVRGDEICRAAQERVAELQSDPPAGREDSIRFAEDLIAVFEDEVAQLESLDPPDERAQAFDRYLDARREAIELLEQGRDAAEQNDPQGYADAQAEAAAGQVGRAELAQRAGLSDCSRVARAAPSGD